MEKEEIYANFFSEITILLINIVLFNEEFNYIISNYPLIIKISNYIKN
jgi:hypothetical protein